jgi:5-methylthioadenosine/S-adenosylhomocysteine deaminase
VTLSTVTPIRELLSVGVPVGYCTDGAASNSTLDVFENMRITAITQKHAADDATWFRSGTALQLAGPGAAAVMGQSGMIGELSVGARADIILVDGKVLMLDRRLTTIDRQALLTEFRQRASALTDRSHGRTIQGYTT